MRKIINKEDKEKYISCEIYKAMANGNLNRMPSSSETIKLTNSTSLSNMIMKNGGFYHWANKLGLEVKKSDTKTGIEYENKCLELLQSKGLKAELTPVKFPYDILVEKVVKIDVKVSNGYDGDFFFFAVNLESKLPKSDFHVVYCKNERSNKILVIPSHLLYGIGQLSIGIESKYDIYKDRWDLVTKQLNFIRQAIAV